MVIPINHYRIRIIPTLFCNFWEFVLYKIFDINSVRVFDVTNSQISVLTFIFGNFSLIQTNLDKYWQNTICILTSFYKCLFFEQATHISDHCALRIWRSVIGIFWFRSVPDFRKITVVIRIVLPCVVVITTEKVLSAESELRFFVASNSSGGLLSSFSNITEKGLFTFSTKYFFYLW